MKNIKKIALSGVVILAFVFYAVHEKMESADAISNVSTSVQQNPSRTETFNPGSQPNNTNVQPTSSTLNYKDGSYVSSVTDAYYGPLQIKVSIANGKISDVEFLKFPDDRNTSIEINNAAMPVLKSEAIRSQMANVDIVSGATQTSEAFVQAMREVLTKAS